MRYVTFADQPWKIFLGFQININIYLKCYLNNKKPNAAEKHERDVSFYGVAVMCSFIRDTRGRQNISKSTKKCK